VEDEPNGARPSKGKSAKGKANKKAKVKSAKANGVVGERIDSISHDAPEPSAAPGEGADLFVSAAAVVAENGYHQREQQASDDVTNGEGPTIVVTGEPYEASDSVVAGEPYEASDSVVTGEPYEASDSAVTAQANGAETAVTDEPGPGTGTRSSTRRRTVPTAVLLLVGAIVVALVVALTLSLLALGNDSSVASSRTSAIAAARTYAVQLASYNYRDLDHDFATVAASSTPSFRRSFTESSDALKSTLTQYHATAKASVVSAGLVSASTSRAVALVFLNQQIANSTQKAATTDRSQVEITLVRSGGRWLIDQVTLL
jgi:Mce-associated membrane protein